MNKSMRLMALIPVLTAIAGLSWRAINEQREPPGIRFNTMTSTIINDTLVRIDAVIDNGEREREFQIFCTAYPDSITLSGVFQAYYYNYAHTYHATIPLK